MNRRRQSLLSVAFIFSRALAKLLVSHARPHRLPRGVTMAFTDNCDLYGAIHEDGVNRAFRHVMRQRPSLFNYATADIAANRELWCSKIDATNDVTKYGNPLFTIMDPLPLLGADAPLVSIGFIAQLTAAKVDFYKGNTIALPAELAPPLQGAAVRRTIPRLRRNRLSIAAAGRSHPCRTGRSGDGRARPDAEGPAHRPAGPDELRMPRRLPRRPCRAPVHCRAGGDPRQSR